MMCKQIIIEAAVIILLTAGICHAAGCVKNRPRCQGEKTNPDPPACQGEKTNPDPVETILKRLKRQILNLNCYQCRMEYLFTQPLFESKTLRTGVLYYQRTGKKSALRINFQTLKQDDEKQQKHIEQYIFDGQWLTRIDYQIKTVEMHQLAEPNEPVDAFELASRNFPIIGFVGTEDLREQFEIKLITQQESKPSEFIQLHLKVKPTSVYKDDYRTVDFWIDRASALPARIVAVSTEGEIYQIKLLEPEVNKGIDKKVFEIRIPEGFTVEERRLEKIEKKKD